MGSQRRTCCDNKFVTAGGDFTFDTFGRATNKEAMRNSYRVSEYQLGEYVWVDLTNANLFSQATDLAYLKQAIESQ